jgi:hypothetical protein
MKTCEVCGRRIRTGYKYCWEHRHTRSDNVVHKATNDYIRFQMNKTFIVWGTFTVLLLIAFLLIGYLVNQIYIALIIGIPISLIVSIYISIKYFNVRFMPGLDVRDKKTDYVKWIQKKVDKVKDEREFRKNLWK